jgi:enamine deaminase RidA (YjgF/YER057c/UK114 family)
VLGRPRSHEQAHQNRNASDLEQEFVDAFEKLGRVLSAGGLGYGDILEMSSYHIGMSRHLDTFRQVRDRYLSQPWPAWSAIGTTELAVFRESKTLHLATIPWGGGAIFRVFSAHGRLN